MEKLGYTCFHGRMMDEFPELYQPWEEALRAKYFNEGKAFGLEEYQKLLGNYNASCNFPGTMVAEDLIKTYPNAKVILTNRDVDKWHTSLKTSVDIGRNWSSFDWIAPFDPVYGPWWRYHKFEHTLRPKLAPEGEKQGFLDHYKMVRSLVPKERLLDYHVSQGWEPLCEFLEKDIPEEEFPNVNNTNQFLNGRRWRWWHAVYCMVVKVSPIAAATAVAVGGAWRYQHMLPTLF